MPSPGPEASSAMPETPGTEPAEGSPGGATTATGATWTVVARGGGESHGEAGTAGEHVQVVRRDAADHEKQETKEDGE